MARLGGNFDFGVVDFGVVELVVVLVVVALLVVFFVVLSSGGRGRCDGCGYGRDGGGPCDGCSARKRCTCNNTLPPVEAGFETVRLQLGSISI